MSESGSNVYPLFGAHRLPTALVHCEGGFGRIAGKTANGLVRHSDRYRIVAVLDSTRAGVDAGMVLGEDHLGIPVHRDLDESIAAVGFVPDHFIVGSTSTSGMLTDQQRESVLDAISRRMDIVNGLHEFLADDREILAAAAFSDVVIDDVGRPKRARDLRMFTGEIHDVPCPRVAVLGTDDAIGKRTTATVLTAALRDRGIRAVLVATSETGLIQGARHGVALDAIPAQFCAGELEGAVIDAYVAEEPDVIVIEGQGALSHPTSMCSALVLRGACPSAVVLQHAPGRAMLSEHPSTPLPTPASEIDLIETFADTKVIGLALNHEGMTDAEVSTAIVMYERTLGVPTTDALCRPPERLAEMVLQAFPRLVGPADAATPT